MTKGPEKGILYIATGKKYVNACIRSAQSVKRYCKGLLIHVFTDEVVTDKNCFDSVGFIVNPHRRSKVDYIGQSPFQKTLYLDADTQVCADITELFDLLDRFDMALAHVNKRISGTRIVWRRCIPYCFPGFNGGVILFKKIGPVNELFEDWKKGFHEAGFKKDQVVLRELLWMSNLRVATLPPEYNILNKKYLRIWSAKEAMPKILHFGSFPQEKTTIIGKFRQRVRTALVGS